VLTKQQSELIQGQKAEIVRINHEYDALRTRMKPLWARTSARQ